MRALLATLATVLATAPAAAAAELTPLQRQEVLVEALREYDKGIALRRSDPEAAREVFRSSARRFQVLADEGIENGRLYYNLANAHLQAGDLGRAVVGYRRAERLAPGDGRIEANLEYARSLCRSRVRPSGRRAITDALLYWHERMALPARFAGAMVAYVGFWLTLVAATVLPSRAWRWALGGLAFLWITAGLSVAADLWWSGDRGAGVLVADDVAVRKGDGEGFALQFEEPLHQGVEFEVVERRGGWLHIRLPDEKTGWIDADAAALVVP